MSQNALKVLELIGKRVLVARETAHAMERELERAASVSGGEVFLDFSGIEGVAPSFLDEVLEILSTSLTGEAGRSPWSLHVLNSPTRLTSKFEAVARGRGVTASELQPSHWLISAGSRDLSAEGLGPESQPPRM